MKNYDIYIDTGVSVKANSEKEAIELAREKFKQILNDNCDYWAEVRIDEKDKMECPNCKKGKIYVYAPIVYMYDVKKDGGIIPTDRISNRLEFFEDESMCNICEHKLSIENDRVITRKEE